MSVNDFEHIAFSGIIPADRTLVKPRETAITEIRDRGMGLRETKDLVEVLGDHIDILKWAGGLQALCRKDFIKEKNEYLESNKIEVSTGGLIERVLLQGKDAVYKFFDESKELGFTTVEVSSGMIVLSLEDKLELVRAADKAGLKPKPEIAMSYGNLPGQAEKIDADMLIAECEACLEAGAWKVVIEEEGIFENVDEWNVEIAYKLITRLGLKNVLFEASEVPVFNWLIYTFGPDVNVFIDNSQVSQLAAARLGIWGKKNIWGRVTSFKQN